MTGQGEPCRRTVSHVMWVRKRIDIGWSELVRGVAFGVRAGDARRHEEAIESIWRREGREPVVCLSVRSGFDRWLADSAFPPGSEVMMSALTIPDMPRIVKAHGLVPVPVDLRPASMQVDVERLAEAITPRTCAIVVAHLFGGRMAMDAVLAVASRHGLPVIEDCAQAFVGFDFVGTRGTAMSMFSFGPIKTHTSLIGAVLTLPDGKAAASLRESQQKWSRQAEATYRQRELKYAGIKALSWGPVAGSVATALRWSGRDHDGMATRMARGFAGGDFFEKIRHRPAVGALRMMAERFARFDGSLIERRRDLSARLIAGIGDSALVLGQDSIDPTYWVFPILVANGEELVPRLWRAGFDATRSSSLQVVEAPEDRPQGRAHVAEATLGSTVFLPFGPTMSERVIDQLATQLRRFARPLEGGVPVSSIGAPVRSRLGSLSLTR